jgi:phytoene desaturase
MTACAIVIGSGFGGLAAAVRLGARGYDVTVLEHLDAPGGRAYVFRQDGFTFDAGPTIITAPFLLEELWSLCGRRFADDVDLRPINPFYRIRFDDGMILDCSDDAAEMTRQITAFAPEDVEGYGRFLKASEAIYRVAFERLAHAPFHSGLAMLKLLPDIARLGGFGSVHALAARCVRDEKLRFALSFHPLFVGGNPFDTTAIYGLIAFLERRWGVHFAMGGTGRIVEGLVGLVRGQGGLVRYDARVAEILAPHGRVAGVRLQSGEVLDADIVVSNADSASTYRDLLPTRVKRGWHARRVEKAKLSMSLFVWYFGTDRRYPEVPHHTILVGPRYRELLRDIFDRKILAEDFSLYLHRPTATDASLAPAGCDAFYVLSPVPHLGANLDWDAIAETYRRKIAAHLARTVLPGLEEHIVSSRMMTPVDFRDRLLSYQGAAFSLAPSLLQSAWFRPHNRSDVAGLYLVGAGTHPGAGVPGVLSSARVLDTVVPHASTVRR